MAYSIKQENEAIIDDVKTELCIKQEVLMPIDSFETLGNWQVYGQHIKEEAIVDDTISCDSITVDTDRTVKIENDYFGHSLDLLLDKRFICAVCGSEFSLKFNLAEHVHIHFNEAIYKCNCKLPNKCLCVIHKTKPKRTLRYHKNEKSYKCAFCKKRFGSKTLLSAHSKRHIEGKPFICSTCGRRLAGKYEMIRHLRVHAKEKPYQCPTCYRHFTQNCVLKRHIRIHTGEKPYSCSTCERHFSRRSTLINHTRTHTKEKPYKCGTCGRCFSQRFSYVQHTKLHIQEWPYTCDMCSRKFKQRASLLTHIKTHLARRDASSTQYIRERRSRTVYKIA